MASDAFVIPRISGSNVACSLLLLLDAARSRARAPILSTSWPGSRSVVAGVLDAHLLQHLPDDQLDVLVVDLDALRLVDLLHLADEVQLGLGRSRPSRRKQVGRVERALVQRIAGLDVLALRRRAGACGAAAGSPRRLLVLASGRRGMIVIFGPSVGVLDVDLCRRPRRACAAPFGFRASKISTTRGRPCVMSAPATPPVWNVRIVSCVPGSPIDCAAMMPTASPISQPSRRWRGRCRSSGGTRRTRLWHFEHRADRASVTVVDHVAERLDDLVEDGRRSAPRPSRRATVLPGLPLESGL